MFFIRYATFFMYLNEINYHGLRINKFKIKAILLKDNSMINAPVNPPVTSRILFEAVAMREPPRTVKVISAIFVEKYFIPKKDEVKADVIVGQAPYDIPVKHKPAIQRGKEPRLTANNVTAAAPIVSKLEQIIVLRRPMVSKSAPVRIRPKPLHTESTPTRETANDSGAFTDSARSLAKLITELPTAAKKEMHIKASQKEGRASI